MPRPVIAQPLPQDLRNWSFRGLDCAGWDFSGRDIRGCDFRNANLNEANFSRSVADRSTKQVLITIAVVVIIAVASALAVVFAVAVAGAGAVAGAIAVAVVFAVAVTVAETGAAVGAFAFAFAGAFAGAGLNAMDALGKGQLLLGFFWSVLAIILLGVAYSFARATIQEVKNATGTNFQGAILKDVNFSHAVLNNCNFDRANTSYVNWSQVEGARSTIDFTDIRMQLLISRDGTNGNYAEMDLRDRHLVGIKLIKANLSSADLTRSNLQHTDLTFANLSNAKAGGTDFRNAILTGACIQNWTINSDTQFADLVCDFIYLTPDQNPQQRRPLEGSFAPGDFEQLVDKFADTLDFILRRGTDPIAFRQALHQFKQDNPAARIKALVELDADRVLVQATVPPDTDKVQVYAAFHATERKLQAAYQEIRYLERTIDDKERTISMMDRLLSAAQQRPINNILQHAETIGDLMPDKSAQYQSSGDINIAQGKSAINTGTGVAAGGNISGTLNLNLAALRDTADPKATELADLISQLRAAIEAPDCDLDDRYKTRALEYLANLATLAQDQPENRLKSAKDNLDDLTDIAEKGSKLATFAQTHLPTFTAAIAAIRLWFGV